MAFVSSDHVASGAHVIGLSHVGPVAVVDDVAVAVAETDVSDVVRAPPVEGAGCEAAAAVDAHRVGVAAVEEGGLGVGVGETAAEVRVSAVLFGKKLAGKSSAGAAVANSGDVFEVATADGVGDDGLVASKGADALVAVVSGEGAGGDESVDDGGDGVAVVDVVAVGHEAEGSSWAVCTGPSGLLQKHETSAAADEQSAARARMRP